MRTHMQIFAKRIVKVITDDWVKGSSCIITSHLSSTVRNPPKTLLIAYQVGETGVHHVAVALVRAVLALKQPAPVNVLILRDKV